MRNPYYFAVDPQGNQLPYVDRMLFDVKSTDMIGVTAANGELTMQARHIKPEDYTLLMSQRQANGYDVLHWYRADFHYVIQPNLNRKVSDAEPHSSQKRELLNVREFRQALSLAIDRRSIILAEYDNQTTPAQASPGPESPFYEPSAHTAFTQYDPKRADRLLDSIGLAKRDYEGYRTFRDGSRMQFYIDFSAFTGAGPAQQVVEDWAKVGIRAIARERSRTLYDTQVQGLNHDFCVWTGNDEYMPLIQPRMFVPVNESQWARAYAKWYLQGGLYGDPASRLTGCQEPPAGPIRQAMEIYEEAIAAPTPEKQAEIFRKALKIAAENVWTIGLSTPPPMLTIVKKGFRNVPRNAVYGWDFQSPGNTGIETYYFERPSDSRGAIEQMKQEILVATPRQPMPTSAKGVKGSGVLGKVLTWSFVAIALALVLMAAVKHPLIGRRMLIMVPTLVLISIFAFTIIQLPPGDFLTAQIARLQESGDQADLQRIEELKKSFWLDEAPLKRYMRWSGLYYFTTWKEQDQGLLQGNMGRSMETTGAVNDLIGDRILLTVLLSLGTILFTWAIAVPIGIYSAVRQYSIGDYIATFIGFIGMCVPNFLLALLLMYVGSAVFGVKVSGLFSAQFAAQPEWTWAKFVDLLAAPLDAAAGAGRRRHGRHGPRHARQPAR